MRDDPTAIFPADVLTKLGERGYRLPPPGFPCRLAFVGQSTFFEACSLNSDTSWAETKFLDHRAGSDQDALSAALHELDPHIVVAFRPELIAPGVLHDISALTLGYLTEPLPRDEKETHDDLQRRLDYLKPVDPTNFDRVVSFDPLMAASASAIVPVWRSVPIPVADELYSDDVPTSVNGSPPLFVGRSTRHREKLLGAAKHEFDALHLAHGVGMEALRDVFDQTTIGINLHNEEYPSFENRVCLHLAAGHLLLSEPLSPDHGIEAGIDFLEVTSPEQLHSAVRSAMEYPTSFITMRLRGRRKAELFRASAVYPRLIHDLFRDVATFGSDRTLAE